MPSSPRKKPEASSAERIEASGGWWPRPESNRRHEDFQSAALPTELLGRAGASGNRSARKRRADYKGKVLRPPRSVALQHSLHREVAGPPNQKKARLKGGPCPLGRRKLRPGFLRFPDAHLARFRHEEE